MKKSLCIILSLMMILLAFAACGEKEGEDFEFVKDEKGQYVLDEEGNKVTKPIEKDEDGNPITTTTTTTTTKKTDTDTSGSVDGNTDELLNNLENFNPAGSKEDLLDEGTETKKTTLYDDVIVKTLKNKKFTMSMTVIGTGTEIPTTITMDGERFGAALSMEGIDAKVLNMNGKSYVAFEYMGLKLYSETEEETISMDDFMSSDIETDQVYVKTTTVKDGDKTYTCEEYKSSDGSITKYYFEGKKWVRHEVISGDEVVIQEINEFNSTVDESVFELKGYTKLDESYLEGLM